MGYHLVVQVLVARAGYEQDVLLRPYRVIKRLGKARGAPAVVRCDDVHTPVTERPDVFEAGDSPVNRAVPSGIQETAGNYFYVPVQPCRTPAVVADRAYDACHMGPVPVEVHGFPAGQHVDPIDIIDISVPVIVHAWPSVRFRLIGPDVRSKVRVPAIDPRVKNSDNDAPVAPCNVPCLGSIDVSVGLSACLAGIVQPPERGEMRIIRQHMRSDEEVRLRIFHFRVLRVLLYAVLCRTALFQFDMGEVTVLQPKLLQHLRAVLLMGLLPAVGRDGRQELDEKFSLPV